MALAVALVVAVLIGGCCGELPAQEVRCVSPPPLKMSPAGDGLASFASNATKVGVAPAVVVNAEPAFEVPPPRLRVLSFQFFYALFVVASCAVVSPFF